MSLPSSYGNFHDWLLKKALNEEAKIVKTQQVCVWVHFLKEPVVRNERLIITPLGQM